MGDRATKQNIFLPIGRYGVPYKYYLGSFWISCFFYFLQTFYKWVINDPPGYKGLTVHMNNYVSWSKITFLLTLKKHCRQVFACLFWAACLAQARRQNHGLCLPQTGRQASWPAWTSDMPIQCGIQENLK
jgi:hypothetical protein